MNDNSLAGMRLIVTGAASGIGFATTKNAIARGARVVALVRTDQDAARLRAEIPSCATLVADMLALPDLPVLTNEAIGLLGGGVDGFVHSAGVFEFSGAFETDLALWQRVFDVNLTASFEIARECARSMVAQGRGSIVLVSSQIGLLGHPRATAYAASKAAVNGLVRALAVELAPDGVRANAVAPGPVETPMTEVARADPLRSQKLLGHVPLGRFGKPEEVAEAILFLLSDKAAFITGQTLCVDGGYTIM
jgi:Dehydrogenases with different specificities (related to short-chain alcohol dehydrogenases)